MIRGGSPLPSIRVEFKGLGFGYLKIARCLAEQPYLCFFPFRDDDRLRRAPSSHVSAYEPENAEKPKPQTAYEPEKAEKPGLFVTGKRRRKNQIVARSRARGFQGLPDSLHWSTAACSIATRSTKK